jgi:hypothetical protein
MKNINIHSGLPQEILRDFLSRKLYDNKVNRNKLEKNFIVFDDSNPSKWAIEDCKSEIEFQTKRLRILEEQSAILTIITNENWTRFDVSEFTELDPTMKNWLTFIGTSEEYDNLIKSINDKK